jgi:hypothetical protein
MMATVEATRSRSDARAECLGSWAREHFVELRHLDDGQQWLVFAAISIGRAFEKIPPLMRLLAYAMAHSAMGLPAPVIAALTDVSDRAVRATKALTANELLHSVRTLPRGRGKPKLGPEYAGTVAKFLVEHPSSQVRDIIAFIRAELGVELDRKTLRVYLTRYGLGCLRGELLADSPLLSEAQTSEVPSC